MRQVREGDLASFLDSNTAWNISGYSATNHDDIFIYLTEANTTAGYFDNVEETTRKGIDVGLSTAFETWSLSMNYNYVKAQYGTDLTLVSENNSSAMMERFRLRMVIIYQIYQNIASN